MSTTTVKTRSVRQVIYKVTNVAFYGWLAFCLYRVFTFFLGTPHTPSDTIFMFGGILMCIAILNGTKDEGETPEVEDDEEDGYGNGESKDDYDLCS